MSARRHVQRVNWQALESGAREKNPTEIQMECLFRNLDQSNLVAPLREVRNGHREAEEPRETEAKRRAALALQERWESSLALREQLRGEIKRGKECLEQVQRDLAGLQASLEEWSTYERICGKNPLLDYMHTISAKERVAQFLPGWLQRREERLRALTREIELCAKENGLEHLL